MEQEEQEQQEQQEQEQHQQQQQQHYRPRNISRQTDKTCLIIATIT